MEDEVSTARASDFGRLLRRYRLAAGLSQEALAERARMSVDGVGALERGHRRWPQRETLALLAGALALDDEQREVFEAAAVRASLPRRSRGTSVTVGPWMSGERSNLPLPLATFIGRERELSEIATLVRAHRMVTLTGPAGVGKTQTALHAGRTLSEDGGLACIVGLASIADPGLVPTAIASALRAQETPNRPLMETLVAYLRNKTLLLVLDNCEHVLDAAAAAALALLAGCEALRILATSREPLMTAGEQRYRLPPLEEAQAIALFTDRAQAIDARFSLSDGNAPIVGEICRRLDGLPLAIELAAARLHVLGLPALRSRLDDRFRLLTGGMSTALPHQRTMRATIDWSYDLLSLAEQRVFERLSILAGSGTLAAATTICASGDLGETDVFDILASLVDKSLVTVDFERSEPRYGLLESFRQYAGERLNGCGDVAAVAQRHATAYLLVAEQMTSLNLNEPTEVSHERWFLEQSNLRAALQWALIDRGEVEVGQRLAAHVCYWEFFAARERRRWMEAALDLVSDTTPPDVLAGLHKANAIVAFHMRDYAMSLASCEIALPQYRALGDSLGLVQVQNALGYALWNLRRVPEARKVFEEALPLARSAASRTALAGIVGGLGMLTEDVSVARRYVAESIQIHKATGNKIGIVYAAINLGICEGRAGNREAALACDAEALAAAADVPAFAGVNLATLALLNIVNGLIELGRCAEAERYARQRLELSRENGLDSHVATSLEYLAVLPTLRREAGDHVLPEALERAALVMGFVDASFARMGIDRYESGKPRYDRAVATLREALGTDRVAHLMAEGASLPQEEAISVALAACPD
jgi:predicted ATPase/transcriptional regulator with XRE-family HTH domain